MKSKELIKQTKSQLQNRLADKKNELASVLYDIKIGQETNFSVTRKVRKEIARIMTALNMNTFSKEEVTEPKETSKKDSKKVSKSDKITKS